MTVKVLVVDDSAFFRRRVTEILEDNTNIKVIGSANNGEEAVEQSRTLKPDVRAYHQAGRQIGPLNRTNYQCN